MPRSALKLEFIDDDTKRQVCFTKRVKGLMKKAEELHTLCDVEVAVIISSPYQHDAQVWPNREGVQKVIADYTNVPIGQRNQRMMDQEGLTRIRIKKVQDALRKKVTENRKKHMTEIMYQCLRGNHLPQHMATVELSDLGFVIDQKLLEINKQHNLIKLNSQPSSSSQAHAPPKSSEPAQVAAEDEVMKGNMEDID